MLSCNKFHAWNTDESDIFAALLKPQVASKAQSERRRRRHWKAVDSVPPRGCLINAIS